MSFNIPAATSLVATVIGLGVSALAFAVSKTPRWERYRLLSATALFASAYCAAEVFSTLAVSPSTLLTVMHLQGVVCVLHIVFWQLYADRHLHRTPARWERVLRVLFYVTAASWLLPKVMLSGRVESFDVSWMNITYSMCEITTLGTISFVIQVLSLLFTFAQYMRAHLRKSAEGAGVHAAAVGAILLAAIHDTFVGTGVYAAPFLLSIGFIASVGAIGLVLARSFIADSRAYDELTQSLEGLVQERTVQLVKAEAALMRSEKLAALGQLSAGVAHEINNPSSAIFGNLEHLRAEIKETGRTPDDAIECLDDSLEAVNRIAKIVRQLVDLNRSAAVVDANGKVSLLSAVNEAVATAKPRLALSHAIEVIVPEDLVAAVSEQSSVVQVLVNIIVNASQAGGGRITIRGTRHQGRDDREQIFIDVEDNGVGMTEETKRRAFEPFFTTRPFGTGMGLGLSRSLGIAHSIGGDLAIESSSVGKTIIRLELPVDSQAPRISDVRQRPSTKRRAV